MQRTTVKVLPSREQVCRLSLKNKQEEAREKPAKIVGKTQQVHFTRSNFFVNKT